MAEVRSKCVTASTSLSHLGRNNEIRKTLGNILKYLLHMDMRSVDTLYTVLCGIHVKVIEGVDVDATRWK